MPHLEGLWKGTNESFNFILPNNVIICSTYDKSRPRGVHERPSINTRVSEVCQCMVIKTQQSLKS